MRFRIVILALIVAVPMLSLGLNNDEEISRLIERAQSAPVDQQSGLCVQIARHELKSANELYTEDKVNEARVALNNVVTYSDKASSAAIQSGKHLKDTEIAMRKMADKLRDIKLKLTIDDQGPVQAASEHLETLRTSLLNHMFKGKK